MVCFSLRTYILYDKAAYSKKILSIKLFYATMYVYIKYCMFLI